MYLTGRVGFQILWIDGGGDVGVNGVWLDVGFETIDVADANCAWIRLTNVGAWFVVLAEFVGEDEIAAVAAGFGVDGYGDDVATSVTVTKMSKCAE